MLTAPHLWGVVAGERTTQAEVVTNAKLNTYPDAILELQAALNARRVVTLDAHQVTLPEAGKTYLITATFSNVGTFGDRGYSALLRCDRADVVISSQNNNQTTGKATWTIYAPPGGPTLVLTIEAELFGVGWTGGVTTGAATWSALVEVL